MHMMLAPSKELLAQQQRDAADDGGADEPEEQAEPASGEAAA